jgi:hypothetical protein
MPLSDSDYEELYLQFFELDTDDLLNVSKYNVLSQDEQAVLYDVLDDRRDEVQFMIDMLNSELRRRKNNVITLKIPEEIRQKIQCSTKLTE